MELGISEGRERARKVKAPTQPRRGESARARRAAENREQRTAAAAENRRLTGHLVAREDPLALDLLRRRVRPARAALALVLHGRHGALGAPVDGGRGGVAGRHGVDLGLVVVARLVEAAVPTVVYIGSKWGV